MGTRLAHTPRSRCHPQMGRRHRLARPPPHKPPPKQLGLTIHQLFLSFNPAASCSANPPPLQAWRAHTADKTGRNTGWREKTRPARPLHRHFREKTRPTRLKTAFFAHFGLAGRTFSRSHPPSGRAGRTFSRPVWQRLEVETIVATTTHSCCPHETTSATAHLR